MEIKDRKLNILNAIIRDYILTAEPIGSRTISKKYDLGISPATIRNEMSDLEELGYLLQPHTSAGRIPSQKAYRLYVDQLMQIRSLGEGLEDNIKRSYDTYVSRLEKAIQHTSKVLSQLTNYTSLVLSPEFRELNCKHVQLIPVQDEKILMVIVSKQGIVKNFELILSKIVDADQLQKLSNILNHCLKDVSLEEVNNELVEKIGELSVEENNLLQEIIPIFKEVLFEKQETRVFSNGVTNIFNFPEFNDIEKAKHFIELIQQRDLLAKILSRPRTNILKITIGTENSIDELKDCSLITTSYQFNGKKLGTIGVIGPTRMDYDHVVSVLDFIRNQLNEHIYKLLSE